MPTPDEQRARLIAALKNARMPTAALDPTSPWMDSADAAAQAAFARLQAGPQEQAGVLYRNANGKYAYSIPTTQKSEYDFALKASPQKGQSLAGIFHTHPGDDEFGHVFSENDIKTAQQLKLPSYVQFLKDGAIRSFTPGQTQTRSMPHPGSRVPYQVADGDVLNSPTADPRIRELTQALMVAKSGSQ